MAAVVILVLAIAGVFLHPPRLPTWSAPAGAAVVVLALGLIEPADARSAARSLVAPLLFLLTAVPFAVLLDRLGFFAAAASLVDGGRHLRLGLWCFAAAVTTLFNLDASVVLLTPLYAQIARRHGYAPLDLAVQPVVLAALASSALPVSNLTNLIAASTLHLRTVDFLIRLGPSSLVAVAVGWFSYRHATGRGPVDDPVHDVTDWRALRRGTPVVVMVLLGFVFGDALDVAPWVVAAIGCVLVLPTVADRSSLHPPFGAAVLALGLGITARAASPHLPVRRLLDGAGWLGDLRAGVAAIVGADLLNNLPALLVALPHIPRGSARIWPVLLGTNVGPALVLTGALAGLLWRDTAKRLGIEVSAARYTRLGLRIGGPAIVASFAVQLLTNALLH